jgi:hypothetical protein
MKGIHAGIMSCLLLFLLSFTAADRKTNSVQHPQMVSTDTPSKQLFIRELRELYTLLTDSNYSKAREYVVHFGEIDDKEFAEACRGLLEMKEISSSGIDSLEKNAKFGKLLDVYGKRGQSILDKVNRTLPDTHQLNPENCYGLYIELTIIEVMAAWDGQHFRLFKLDNVGKLNNRGFDE